MTLVTYGLMIYPLSC